MWKVSYNVYTLFKSICTQRGWPTLSILSHCGAILNHFELSANSQKTLKNSQKTHKTHKTVRTIKSLRTLSELSDTCGHADFPGAHHFFSQHPMKQLWEFHPPLRLLPTLRNICKKMLFRISLPSDKTCPIRKGCSYLRKATLSEFENRCEKCEKCENC